MLAKVSPASYLLMIEGQSCWGIFPLLLDLSMSRPFATALICLLLVRNSQIFSSGVKSTPLITTG
jgi:hypothetical protein